MQAIDFASVLVSASRLPAELALKATLLLVVVGVLALDPRAWCCGTN